MAELPEFVYLVTMDTEWPITVIVDYGVASVAADVEQAVEKRLAGGPDRGWSRNHVHVWKARLADVREVELVPSTVVEASLRERDSTEEQRP